MFFCEDCGVDYDEVMHFENEHEQEYLHGKEWKDMVRGSMTTVKQRKAWQEVHKALTDYIINFGPIEIEQEDKHILLDDLYFANCGKILSKLS